LRIFLNFDGVLRRDSSPKSKLDADCVRNLELAVLTHPEARVVVTSTWRLVHQLDDLRRLFSTEFGARIEGVTRDLPEVEGNPRHAEIQVYLAAHPAPDLRWIAIDNDVDGYPLGAPLILVNTRTGFDQPCAQRLRIWLAQPR
jgi:hypothetical protein